MGQNITQLHVQVTPRKKEGEEKNPKDYQKKIRRLYQLYRLNASNVQVDWNMSGILDATLYFSTAISEDTSVYFLAHFAHITNQWLIGLW